MKQVLTKKGLVSGVAAEGCTIFWGIPYAKAPVGDLRWREPRECDPWDGVLAADHYAKRSMQPAGSTDFYGKEFADEPERMTPTSEDSLYLNIWTPAEQAGEKLPVAFWIHGGAYMGGNGHEKEFSGVAYAKRGVILVTINYRLGPMGFFAHPALSAERNGLSGNYGTMDQIAALKWVRENIEAFGGDPDNITVMGQSAGSMSVQTLVSSPLTKGMIAKAILQSGCGLSYDHMLSAAEAEGTEMADALNAKTAEELRALSYEDLMKVAEPLIIRGFPTGKLVFTPVIDNYLLEDGYNALLEQGRVHDIPYMVGSTKNDIMTDPRELEKGNLGRVYEGSRHWAEIRRDTGSKPAYLYYFTRQLPGDDAGAFHSSELWYMFGTLGSGWRPFTQEDYALSERMLDYWTNFMKNGDPNGLGLPAWNPYRNDEDIRVLDVD